MVLRFLTRLESDAGGLNDTVDHSVQATPDFGRLVICRWMGLSCLYTLCLFADAEEGDEEEEEEEEDEEEEVEEDEDLCLRI